MKSKQYFLVEDITTYSKGVKSFTQILQKRFYPDAYFFSNNLLLIKTKDSQDNIRDKICETKDKYHKSKVHYIPNYGFRIHNNKDGFVEYPSEFADKFISLEEMYNYLKQKNSFSNLEKTDKATKQKFQLSLFSE